MKFVKALLICLLCAVILSGCGKVESPDFLENYYLDYSKYIHEKFYSRNAGLGLGDCTVDGKTIVRVYDISVNYNAFDAKALIDSLVSDYKSGVKFSDMFFGSRYYGTVSDGRVAEMYSGTLGALYVYTIYDDMPYKYPESDALNKEIAELFPSGNIEPKYVCFINSLTGILLSDGEKEYFLVLQSKNDFADSFKAETLYPVSDIFDFIEANKTALIGS